MAWLLGAAKGIESPSTSCTTIYCHSHIANTKSAPMAFSQYILLGRWHAILGCNLGNECNQQEHSDFAYAGNGPTVGHPDTHSAELHDMGI